MPPPPPPSWPDRQPWGGCSPCSTITTRMIKTRTALKSNSPFHLCWWMFKTVCYEMFFSELDVSYWCDWMLVQASRINIIYPWAVYCEGPPSFIWRGGVNQKLRHYIFQSTTDIHIQNAHKTLFQSTVDIHFQNTKKLLRLALCAFIYCLYYVILTITM